MKTVYTLFIVFGLLAGCVNTADNFLSEPNTGGRDSAVSGGAGSEGAASESNGNQR